MGGAFSQRMSDYAWQQRFRNQEILRPTEGLPRASGASQSAEPASIALFRLCIKTVETQ
jgi:hypothetical protein